MAIVYTLYVKQSCMSNTHMHRHYIPYMSFVCTQLTTYTTKPLMKQYLLSNSCIVMTYHVIDEKTKKLCCFFYYQTPSMFYLHREKHSITLSKNPNLPNDMLLNTLMISTLHTLSLLNMLYKSYNNPSTLRVRFKHQITPLLLDHIHKQNTLLPLSIRTD